MARSETSHPIVAAGYDTIMRPADKLLGMDKQRRRTVASATGRVLEVGFGTGLNLPYYPEVTEVVGVEPDPHMRRRATTRMRAVAPRFPVELVPAAAEQLPFDDDAFDTVVVCLVLCTVDEPRRALQEARRVLAPDGQLLMLEHVRSERPAITWMQHALTPVWRNIAGGCHLDRRTVALAEDVGFTFEHLWRSGSGTGMMIQGRARPT